jgi:hypothetical protein
MRAVVNEDTSLYTTASTILQSHYFLATLCKREGKQQKAAENYQNEFRDMYSSTHIIWVIKSRRIRREVFMVHKGQQTYMYRILMRKLLATPMVGQRYRGPQE